MENKQANWTDSRIGGGAAMAYSLAMISPINEVVRVAALASSEAITNGNKLSNALVLGLSTLAIEGSSGVVLSDLLSSKRAETIRHSIYSSKRGEKLAKAISEGKGSNLSLEMGTGLLAGTPVAMLARELRNPKQDRNERRKYSLLMSIGTAAVIGSAFYGVEEGIGVNGTFEVGGALIGLGVIYSLFKVVKNRA